MLIRALTMAEPSEVCSTSLRNLVELVVDLPDDLFEDVLHRDDALRAAELVDDDRHRELALLHVAQELADLRRFGDDVGGPQDVVEDDEVAVLEEADEVLGMDDADDVVDRFV